MYNRTAMSSTNSPKPSKIFSPEVSVPRLWRLFLTFLLIGLQSFGGGSATFLLIHQTCLKNGWMDDEEFVRNWAICQLAPGINLIKITILIGRKLRGWPGLIAAASGLLIPSALVTALMTAFYTLYRDHPLLQAAMRGILPATIGLSLAMSANLVVPVFKAARAEGRLRLILQGLVVVAACLVMALNWLSPLSIMAGASLLTALLMTALPPATPAGGEK